MPSCSPCCNSRSSIPASCRPSAENGGVFTSDDAGATWKKVSDDHNIRQRSFYFGRIYADPKNKDAIYVCNVAFHKSTDGGKTYRTVRTPHSDNHDLWIDPTNPLRMVESNDGGGARSYLRKSY